MQINFAAREIAIKLVYYGPALSGKTTNLRALHERIHGPGRGRLMTLETRDERTLFFDMLPLAIAGLPVGPSPSSGPPESRPPERASKPPSQSGSRPPSPPPKMSIRLKIFTVPGQVLHTSTRRIVLQGVDGIAFIADSQVAETENNAVSFLDLRENLRQLGVVLADTPLVIQFNKRDLPNVRSDEEIVELAQRGKEPVFAAIASRAVGVVETFFAVLKHTWAKLEHEHKLSSLVGVPPDAFVAHVARQLGIVLPSVTPAALKEPRL